MATRPLNEIVSDAEAMLRNADDIPNDYALIHKSEFQKLVQAAKLLIKIHRDADAGVLDGVDLDWMVQVDELLYPTEDA